MGNFFEDVIEGVAPAVGGFLGGPLGAGVGSAVSSALGNQNATAAAAGAVPQFATQLQAPIDTQLGRVADTNVASFGGDRVADFTANQQQGLGMADILAQTLGNQADTAGAGFNTFAGGANVGSNPHLEGNIAALRDNARIDFERNQLPGIQNNAIASGGIGGTRQGIAQGVALGDLNRSLNTTEGQLRSDQLNTDLSQQLQALINQGNILSGQTAGQDQLIRTGTLQQQQNQAEIGGEREAFNEQNADQFARDQELLRILIGGPSGTPPVPNLTNPGSALLGGAAAFSQLFPQQPNQAPSTTFAQPVIPGNPHSG